LTYAEEIIIANQRLAQQLDQEAETNKTKLSQLHQDLQNAIDQNNDELVGQIHRQIYQLSSGNDQQVTAYQYENNFLQKELTNLSNLHLVKSQSKLKKTVAIVAKLLEYFEDDQLPSPTNGLTSNRNSLFIQSRKKELLIANDKVKELASQTLIKDITNMNDQEKIKGLHGNLA
jgi:hypothetical protein